VPKVQPKPIKVQERVQTKRAKDNPKAALVWRTGLSGMPPDSVRCTREFHFELATFGNSGGCSAIIHRTIRCSTGLSGVAPDCPVRQAEKRLQAPTVVCNGYSEQEQRRLHAQSQSRRQKAHRTVNRTCLVHHRTVRWPSCQKLQRSEPNGLVTWLAHQTVRCAIRQKPSPTVLLVVGAINTPQPPHLNASKFSAFKPHTRALDFTPRHKQRDQILSQVQRSFQSNSD
jgi:hypothetical protein